MGIEDMWVVEFSASQAAFHIELAVEAMQNNRRRFLENPHDVHDWIPLHIGTKASCERVALMGQPYIENFGVETGWYRQMH